MKRLAIFILVVTIFLSTILTAQASASIDGFQFYPADYIWNVPVDTLPVDPMSETYVNSMSGPSAYIYIAKTLPINVVDENTPKQYLTSCWYPWVCDPGPYPIPSNPLIETSGTDHHMLIVNRDTNTLYEMFYAVKAANGTWSAGSAVTFDLSSYALRQPEGEFTADAAGLAMAPGIITFDEIAAGEINHAIRFAAWRTQNTHVWPARDDGSIASKSYPPFGQRFRLKASFDTSGYGDRAKIILEAFKKYGVILADNNGDSTSWTVHADTDPRWADNYALFNQMKNVHPTDFEAVNVTSLIINKDSGQARITPIVIPPPPPAIDLVKFGILSSTNIKFGNLGRSCRILRTFLNPSSFRYK